MRYTSLAFLLAIITLVSANREDLWREWKRVYQKSYNDANELARREQWERNVDKIQAHNLRHDLGLETYTVGLNQFSDLSWDEFEQTYLNKMLPITTPSESEFFVPNANDVVPASLDWRKEGVVTAVKNQGHCSSCWAFSTVGAVESQYRKQFNETKLFSEQQLVDCSFFYGNHGCSGGFMENAYRYLFLNKLETQDDYPYVAQTMSCKYNQSKGHVKVSTWQVVRSGNEDELKRMVATLGPAAVAINVDWGFQTYRSGIYLSKACNPHAVNHGLLTVGYGTDAGLDYWIIKNSWSSWWGEHGYIRFGRNHNNMCGIASFASVPSIVKA